MVPDQRDPRLTPPRSPGGYIQQVRSRAPSNQEIWLSLGLAQPPNRARGLARASDSRSMRRPSSGLGSCPAWQANQGPGIRRKALRHRGLGAPRRRTLGVALLATSAIGSRIGRDTRRQASHSLLGLVGSQAHTLAPRANLLHHQECSRTSTWGRLVQANTA
jgi:hypothetical protein